MQDDKRDLERGCKKSDSRRIQSRKINLDDNASSATDYNISDTGSNNDDEPANRMQIGLGLSKSTDLRFTNAAVYQCYRSKIL